MDNETVQNNKPGKGKKIRAYIALTLVVLVVIIAGWIWYKDYSAYITTDDAYIDADKVAVSAKIMGRIVKMYADEGDSVKAGQLLVELDSTDLIAQKIQATAAREQAISALHQSQARYDLDLKTSLVQEINMAKAKEDFDRATAQLSGKVISQEQYDHAKKSYESSQAQLEAAKAQLGVSKAQIESSESSIKVAGSQIGTIETMLGNTRILSPVSGRVAKRWLLPGDVTQPGQAVMTITKDSLLWVISLFEETKISGIHKGQKTEFTLDAYPGIEFYGKVFYLGTNTASQFSLIPPNNASGNFTKITQRIPVKISIDSVADPKKKYDRIRLAAGMSVLVKIFK